MGLGKKDLIVNRVLACSPGLIVVIVGWNWLWQPRLPSWELEYPLQGKIDTGGSQFLHPLIDQHYLLDCVVTAGPAPWTLDSGDVFGLCY
jgi:hypothetical protein